MRSARPAREVPGANGRADSLAKAGEATEEALSQRHSRPSALIRWIPCCASTACRCSTTCPIRPWKTPCARLSPCVVSLASSYRMPLPDETTILNFRHFLERHKLGDKIFQEVNRQLKEQGLMLREGSINRNLSGWCVSQIPTEPDEFDEGAVAWTLPSSRPVWGTWP